MALLVHWKANFSWNDKLIFSNSSLGLSTRHHFTLSFSYGSEGVGVFSFGYIFFCKCLDQSIFFSLKLEKEKCFCENFPSRKMLIKSLYVSWISVHGSPFTLIQGRFWRNGSSILLANDWARRFYLTTLTHANQIAIFGSYLTSALLHSVSTQSLIVTMGSTSSNSWCRCLRALKRAKQINK